SAALRNPEPCPQRVTAAGRVELALDVVAVAPTQSCPRRDAARIRRRIEAVLHQDAEQVADYMAIVEVVPNEHLHSKAGRAQLRCELSTEPALDLVRRQDGPVGPRSFVADPVDLEHRQGLPPSCSYEKISKLSVSVPGRIEMRIDALNR